MTTILGVQRSFSDGVYLVSVNESGSISTVTIKGSPQDLVSELNVLLTPSGSNFMLLESGDFLLLETTDKIRL